MSVPSFNQREETEAYPDRTELRAAWERAFDAAPDRYLSPRLMAKALAWHRQCEAEGGLPRSLTKRLALIGASPATRAAPAAGLAPGALLVREWNGRAYHVEVLEDGFRFDGTVWPSLSAIGRRITGTSWSGPRFFGLRSRGTGAR
ncbi:MAG: DUF2924 domain-containing protein [Pseudomonadota bacterium]